MTVRALNSHLPARSRKVVTVRYSQAELSIARIIVIIKSNRPPPAEKVSKNQIGKVSKKISSKISKFHLRKRKTNSRPATHSLPGPAQRLLSHASPPPLRPTRNTSGLPSASKICFIAISKYSPVGCAF